jgi:hypothetical protein
VGFKHIILTMYFVWLSDTTAQLELTFIHKQKILYECLRCWMTLLFFIAHRLN